MIVEYRRGYPSPMRIRSAVAALAVLIVAGCTSQAAGTAPQNAAGGSAPVAAKKVEGLDAASVVKKLKAANLGLTNVAVQDENTDPNNLLGRPGLYTSRASADLPGGDKTGDKGDTDRGLVVEVFDTPELAKKRGDHIAQLKDGSSGLGTEWQYYTSDGTGLVRVSGNVKPSLAKKVQAAVAAL
jgi:hypothetical protein